jgi:hypothetical protein
LRRAKGGGVFIPGRKVQEETPTAWLKAPPNSSVEREKFLSDLAMEEARKRSEERRLEREQRKAKLEERERIHRERKKAKQKVVRFPYLVRVCLFVCFTYSA